MTKRILTNFLLALTMLTSCTYGKFVIDFEPNTEKELAEAVVSNCLFVVIFYKENCRYCGEKMKDMDRLQKKYSDALILRIDRKKYRKISRMVAGVGSGVPTVLIIKYGHVLFKLQGGWQYDDYEYAYWMAQQI